MTPPLVLPLSAADLVALAATVRRLWLEACAACGVDLQEAEPLWDALRDAGELRIFAAPPHLPPRNAAIARAKRHVAESLRGDPWYYIVADTGGVRVLGWAATQAYPVPGRPAGCSAVERIADLEPRDPRRQAHDAAVLAARQARQAAAGARPGAPGSESRGEMAARRARR